MAILPKVFALKIPFSVHNSARYGICLAHEYSTLLCAVGVAWSIRKHINQKLIFKGPKYQTWALKTAKIVKQYFNMKLSLKEMQRITFWQTESRANWQIAILIWHHQSKIAL